MTHYTDSDTEHERRPTACCSHQSQSVYGLFNRGSERQRSGPQVVQRSLNCLCGCKHSPGMCVCRQREMLTSSIAVSSLKPLEKPASLQEP